MRNKREPNRKQTLSAELLRSITESLDHVSDGGERARDACLSRYHYQRRFRGFVGEAPHRLYRRLILERAAYELRATSKEITVIGLESNYRTAEGFSRAFRRAFGLSPRAYRKAARQIRLLPGSCGVHFDPSAETTVTASSKGISNMDLIDRLLESDYGTKRRILECARLLSDSQLDAPLVFRHNLMPWAEPAKTLRESLGFITGFGWRDQMFQALGWEPKDDHYRHVSGSSATDMIERFDSFHEAYRAFVADVREQNLWNQEWVDDTCEQPETFSIGRVIEETLTWGIAYRSVLVRQMEQMGFQLDTIKIPAIK